MSKTEVIGLLQQVVSDAQAAAEEKRIALTPLAKATHKNIKALGNNFPLSQDNSARFDPEYLKGIVAQAYPGDDSAAKQYRDTVQERIRIAAKGLKRPIEIDYAVRALLSKNFIKKTFQNYEETKGAGINKAGLTRVLKCSSATLYKYINGVLPLHPACIMPFADFFNLNREDLNQLVDIVLPYLNKSALEMAPDSKRARLFIQSCILAGCEVDDRININHMPFLKNYENLRDATLSPLAVAQYYTEKIRFLSESDRESMRQTLADAITAYRTKSVFNGGVEVFFGASKPISEIGLEIEEPDRSKSRG